MAYAVYGVAVGVMIASAFAGHLGKDSDVDSQTVLRLVQPNIPQNQKWGSDYIPQNFETLLQLSVDAPWPMANKRLTIWPETAAMTLTTAQTRQMQAAVDTILENEGDVLLAGILDTDGDAYFNRFSVFNDAGEMIDVYDKSHLVPFGEYIPFSQWLPIDPVAYVGPGFMPGAGPKTLQVSGVPKLSALVCYEVIFSGRVVDRHGQRPELLTNVTNDAWYGVSAGPYQHLAISRVRAIEEGVPLVRVANTGVSAMFDAYGNTRVQIPLGEAGSVTTPLPLPREKTLFSRFGNMIPLLMLLGAFTATILVSPRQRQSVH